MWNVSNNNLLCNYFLIRRSTIDRMLLKEAEVCLRDQNSEGELSVNTCGPVADTMQVRCQIKNGKGSLYVGPIMMSLTLLIASNK